MERTGEYIIAIVEARNALDNVHTIATKRGLALDVRVEVARRNLERMIEELFPTPAEADDEEKAH